MIRILSILSALAVTLTVSAQPLNHTQAKACEAKQGLELIYDISNKTMQCSLKKGLEILLRED